MKELRPGDLMFGPISGLVPGVMPVGVGQLLLAGRKDRLTWRRWWRVRHAGVVVKASETLPPGTVRDRTTGAYYPPGSWRDMPTENTVGTTVYTTGVITAPRLVQAMPHGAEEIDMKMQKHWTAQHVYVRPAWNDQDGDFASQGEEVAEAVHGYVGTPYNFLTYAKLAAGILGLPISERVLARWISTRKDMMCSQLVDQALADAGYHVFDDGRLPQDVVPAELFRALITTPGAKYIVPGMPAWAEAADYTHRGWR